MRNLLSRRVGGRRFLCLLMQAVPTPISLWTNSYRYFVVMVTQNIKGQFRYKTEVALLLIVTIQTITVCHVERSRGHLWLHLRSLVFREIFVHLGN
jgi:hypothetical protein